ncbi:MAG: MotA/TolQ/ExbB proton channel family protein [Sphingomonadales bacterium]
MIRNLEDLMFQVSDLFLAPVLVLLIALFLYSLYALGAFAAQAWRRRRHSYDYHQALATGLQGQPPLDGYPLASLVQAKPTITQDELDVAALEEVEGVRMVSRLAPMLGLVATMAPMGPALKSLADGDIQGISDNLIVAFSAVIFGLVIASITFWIASIKKRWLAKELVSLAPHLEQATMPTSTPEEMSRAAA